jgi:hypothetical protein
MVHLTSSIRKNESTPQLFDNHIVLLTLGELADRLKISSSGLRKIIARDSTFPKYKVGQQLRFDWNAVERYFRKGDS